MPFLRHRSLLNLISQVVKVKLLLQISSKIIWTMCLSIFCISKLVWFTIDLLCWNPTWSLELWINNWFHTGVDKPLEDLVGNTKQRYWMMALKVLHRLLWLWDCNYQHSTPDFGNYESTQAGRKPHYQDFRAVPAWSTSSRQTESGPGTLHGFTCNLTSSYLLFPTSQNRTVTRGMLWPVSKIIQDTCN